LFNFFFFNIFCFISKNFLFKKKKKKNFVAFHVL
jgi:hypothetical protein